MQAINRFQIEVGGPLHGGDPGRRLIEPSGDEGTYVAEIPPAFARREDEWLIVAAHHVFGSEELSALSAGIAELTPAPYIGLNPPDMRRLRLEESQEVRVSVNGESYRLPVKARPALPEGVAALPVGLPGLSGIALPAWGKLSRT